MGLKSLIWDELILGTEKSIAIDGHTVGRLILNNVNHILCDGL